MGKLTISMAIYTDLYHSYVSHYQRVSHRSSSAHPPGIHRPSEPPRGTKKRSARRWRRSTMRFLANFCWMVVLESTNSPPLFQSNFCWFTWPIKNCACSNFHTCFSCITRGGMSFCGNQGWKHQSLINSSLQSCQLFPYLYIRPSIHPSIHTSIHTSSCENFLRALY